MTDRKFTLGARSMMRYGLWVTAVFALLCSGCKSDDDETGADESRLAAATSLAGSWHYRSFYNSDTSSARTSADPATTAYGWLWAEGTMTLEVDSESQGLTGTMEFLPGISLDVTVTLMADEEDDITILEITGMGIDDTTTEGWEYSLFGVTVPDWNIGTSEQTPSVVGSVTNPVAIAGDPPIGADLGTVGSFMLVKLSD